MKLRYLVIVLLLISSTRIVYSGIISVQNANGSAADNSYVLAEDGMAEGELVHIDRDHTFPALPAFMTGIDYVKTANNDKQSSNLIVELTFDGPTTLYLSLDNRIGSGSDSPPNPGDGTATQWVIDQGWNQTTQTWAKVGDEASPYTVYTLLCLTNEFTLYGQYVGGNMYSIAGADYTNTIIPYASIDIGPSGHRLESTWTELPSAPVYSNEQPYGPAAVAGKTPDTIQLSVNSVDWRDRGDSTNNFELLRTMEDFVKDNEGSITLTLDNLRQGHYLATTYHIDSDTNQSPRIQVYVSDLVSSNRLQATRGDASAALGSVNNLTKKIIEDSAAEFEFWADGTNAVIIRFQGTPGNANNSSDDETPLNGIELGLDIEFHPPLIENYALIDFGPDGQRSAPGSIALPALPTGLNHDYGPVSLTSDNGDSFTLTVDSLNTNGVSTGTVDWYDRGDSSLINTLAYLCEDLIINDDGILRITLGGMKAGTYRIIGFHNDSSNNQCEDIQIYVTDDNGTAIPQDLGGDAEHPHKSLSNMTDEGLLTTASAFEVVSDGSSNIFLYFDGTKAADNDVPLNGLHIEKVIDTSLPPVYPKGTLMILR